MDKPSPYALYMGTLAPNSRRSIQSQLNKIADIMEWPPDSREQMFHQVDYQIACRIKVELAQQGSSGKTINRAMSTIRNIVKVAVLMGVIPENQLIQLSSIKHEKSPQYQGNPLNATQVMALLSYLDLDKSVVGFRNKAIFGLLLGAGLRRSELVALKLNDLTLAENRLIVQKGKGNKRRIAFLPDWCVERLHTWLLLRGNEGEYLFNPVNRTKRINIKLGITTETIYQLVRSVSNHVGLNNLSPHDLRRTFITRLLEQDVDLNTVRQMAGHADISTTIIYDKRDQAVMQKAAAKLSYNKQKDL
ncbi:tyrosine-type recombinase/integrase [Paraglaciecola aquimarina]|uniref:Tyrosine-type recombinase/integrase n=1 Tax=Paraglaciecola algarum TaxID=3050085 RepID=A0ABS9D8H1_9ALTE|nr:tyrosine-type recombinase/integrase [Paraglaciecola sp. G1-23]MCF2949263.1 tyrosine-type recombinase/integrase [Paraglaciecola sp. G1-23]